MLVCAALAPGSSAGVPPVQQEALPWPAIVASTELPQVTSDIARHVACTCPAGTGLGWDKLHPRAVTRSHDGVLEALVRIFVLCVLLGC